MDRADFSGFLKTIVWLVLIYAIKFLFRFLGPFLLQKAVQKVEKNFNEKAKDFYNQTQNQYSGSNSQSYSANSNTSKSDINVNDLREKKKVGEYIDYEELN
nr:DUF4834 family protein [uncultured Flavobacterium sp.]